MLQPCLLCGHSTCDRPQRLSPGSLGHSVTCETTAEMPFMAVKAELRAALEEVPAMSVPVGPMLTAIKPKQKAAPEEGLLMSVCYLLDRCRRPEGWDEKYQVYST